MIMPNSPSHQTTPDKPSTPKLNPNPNHNYDDDSDALIRPSTKLNNLSLTGIHKKLALNSVEDRSGEGRTHTFPDPPSPSLRAIVGADDTNVLTTTDRDSF